MDVKVSMRGTTKMVAMMAVAREREILSVFSAVRVMAWLLPPLSTVARPKIPLAFVR